MAVNREASTALKNSKLLRDALENLKNCVAGSRNTQELLSRVKTIIPLEENQYKIITVQGKLEDLKRPSRPLSTMRKILQSLFRIMELKTIKRCELQKRKKQMVMANIR